ncbi:uncharacterized protein VTP21DRAFT_8310 [Calcarisporiella thermophila]|uniref:uncharacterized protein n=1 Tax=Calcarisporiella thermophila TaxID=911321 RepID=UPI003744B15D
MAALVFLLFCIYIISLVFSVSHSSFHPVSPSFLLILFLSSTSSTLSFFYRTHCLYLHTIFLGFCLLKRKYF